MTIDNAIASLAVKQLSSAQKWYEALLGRVPDSTPMPSVAEWKFPRGGWLQVYELAERAGNGSVTLAVRNLEELLPHIKRLGIDISQKTSSAKVKTLTIIDLDGNQITFAEAIDPTMAR